ncbi:MAG: ligand-binding sensor domain-containing protein, partial [Methanosarcinaceae archaeon]
MKYQFRFILALLFTGFMFCYPLFAQRVTTYKKGSGLVDNTVHSLFFDSIEKLLWIGTNKGLVTYNSQENVWQEFSENANLPDEKVNAILIAADSSLWVGTESGLAKFKNDRWEYFPNPETRTQLLISYIRCLFQDTNSKLWIGTTGGGVSSYSPGESFRTHYYDCPGTLYTTTICEDTDNNIWVGTQDSGLYRLNADSVCTQISIPGLSDRINILFKDCTDTLWVGTSQGAAKKIRRNNRDEWENITRTQGNNIKAIHQDGEKRIWFGTDKGVMFIYNHGACDASALQLSSTTTMIRDKDGYLWVGTKDNGVARIHLNWREFSDSPDGLTEGYIITSIAQDEFDNLWLGTDNTKIIKYDQRSFQVIDVNDGNDTGGIKTIN